MHKKIVWIIGILVIIVGIHIITTFASLAGIVFVLRVGAYIFA